MGSWLTPTRMHRLCFTQLLPVVLGELLCCCYLHVALMGVYIYIWAYALRPALRAARLDGLAAR